MKLFITSRNGIEVINLDKVVYLKADGNYTDFYFCDGKVRPHLSTLAVFDEAITARYASADKPSPFFRMGRSYVINVSYVTSMNLGAIDKSCGESVRRLTQKHVAKRYMKKGILFYINLYDSTD